MKKEKLIAAVMAVFLMFPATAFAAAEAKTEDDADTVVKEYTFTTKDKDFEYTDNRRIKEDGRNYKAADIEYELVSEEKRVSETRSYSNLASEQVPETITASDGSVLTLEDADFTPVEVTDIEVYRGQVEAPDIPKTITFSTNGVTVTGSRKSVKESVSSTYDMPFTVTGKFYGDEDSLYYELNGKNIPTATAPEFNEYKSELLAYLNIDPNLYRIDSGSWAGGYYSEGGRTVRRATYTGMQKSRTYTVTYSGYVYDATATYSNGIDHEEPIYTVKAIVTYEKALSTLQKVLIGAGLALLALAIVLILVFLAKKKKGDKDEKAA